MPRILRPVVVAGRARHALLLLPGLAKELPRDGDEQVHACQVLARCRGQLYAMRRLGAKRAQGEIQPPDRRLPVVIQWSLEPRQQAVEPDCACAAQRFGVVQRRRWAGAEARPLAAMPALLRAGPVAVGKRQGVARLAGLWRRVAEPGHVMIQQPPCQHLVELQQQSRIRAARRWRRWRSRRGLGGAGSVRRPQAKAVPCETVLERRHCHARAALLGADAARRPAPQELPHVDEVR
mmetsp:Transcript_3113/g.8844  ORF Transcript_3113/g.8844 Transcript_3113/m.8844 type:complete len:236 (+) Transcript_3113:275-982(+)